MRIFFAGTPEISVAALATLHQQYNIVSVLTAPDAPIGRKAIITPPPVKVQAQALGLSVLQPAKINAEFIQQVRALQPDIFVCFAYGKIFPQSFLDIFPIAAINVHPSLLPHWRGPSPIQAAIMAGESVSGITIQHMVKTMDEGPIIVQEKLAIAPQDTAFSLKRKVAQQAGALLLKAIGLIEEKKSPDIAQDHTQATYCHFITKETARLDYQRPAAELVNLVRAMYDAPIAYTHWKGQRLQVFQAYALEQNNIQKAPIGHVIQYHKQWGILVQTCQGILALQEVQLAGKKRLSHKDFIHGYSSIVGDCLE